MPADLDQPKEAGRDLSALPKRREEETAKLGNLSATPGDRENELAVLNGRMVFPEKRLS